VIPQSLRSTRSSEASVLVSALSASADDGAEILVRQDEQVFASHCHGTPVCLLYADAVTSAWLPPCVGRGSPETAPWATKGTVIR
jgi:hypothetical protein